MIAHRLRGLINLHVVATAGIAAGYFLAAALGVPYVPFLELSRDVNLLLYSMPIILGLLYSARFWNERQKRFLAMTWMSAIAISARQILAVALLMFALIVATKDHSVSRLFLATYLVSCSVLLVFVNRLLPGYLTDVVFGRSHRIPTLFVGPQKALKRLEGWILQQEHLGINVVGMLSDDPVSDGTQLPGPWLGKTADLSAVFSNRDIGQVVLLELPARAEQVQEIIEICQSEGSRLLVYQDLWERLPIPMVPVLENQHLFLTVHDEPLEDPFNRGVKRLLDICVSLPVVVFILPFLCLVVGAVQMIQAPGPLLFRRNRGGQRGRDFEMLKFRSMRNAARDENLEARQARKGDDRIYPFGHFLRKTSLDEFPQFLNVLRGDMSLVGPRPHLPKHDMEFSLVAKTYRTRQLVKPGITGLAQVSGFRGEIDDLEMLHKRVQMDIEYITNWSVLLDIEIILRTFGHVLLPPKNAR